MTTTTETYIFHADATSTGNSDTSAPMPSWSGSVQVVTSTGKILPLSHLINCDHGVIIAGNFYRWHQDTQTYIFENPMPFCTLTMEHHAEAPADTDKAEDFLASLNDKDRDHLAQLLGVV